MGNVKSLAKDTAVYGLSSIVGRFLNWCLVPLYTNLFPKEEYGIVTFVYSVVAVALIVLTYGMETGFFRFANHKHWSDPMQVYSTALVSLAVSSITFFIGVLIFLSPITVAMECVGHPSYVWMMALCVAIDAFTSLPFSYLRYLKKPIKFATLRLINIAVNIGLNLFFLLLCPWLVKTVPSMVSWWYNPEFGIGYIFLSNLIASLLLLPMLWREITGFHWRFCSRLWCEMLAYSWPLLLLGIAGVMNQTFDKLMFPSLWKGGDALALLGVYGANYKIAIVMVMFIQAFRFAYEPFIFAQNKENGKLSERAYTDAMKFFCIMSLFIFMSVMFYLDILRYVISPKYFSGLGVVPIVMMAEFFFGVHFNLSVWYKLSDRTVWGAYLSFLGLAITIILNVLLVPHFGYMGCAWAAFFCYFTMMVTNYFVGQHYYKINYPVKRILIYVAITGVLYLIGLYIIVTPYAAINYVIRALLLCLYLLIVKKGEHISIGSLCAPILNKMRR